METENNVQKGWRTHEQKEEIIHRWEESGKSRKEFCEENQINYNSLVTWCKQLKDLKVQKASSAFSEIKVKEVSGLFAQVHLSGGIRIDFFHALPAEYFQSLFRH